MSEPKGFSFFVEKFLAFQKSQGFSAATLRVIEAAVWEFLVFAKQIRKKRDIRELGQADLEEFVLYLDQRKKKSHAKQSQKLSVSHKNRTITQLKKFFTFLVGQDYIMSNPAEKLRYFPEGERVPRDILSEREMKKLLKTIDQRRPTGKRDYCIFRLLYGTGLRKGELEALALRDVDLAEGQVFVRGKFSKERRIPLGENLQNILQSYLEKARPFLVKNNPVQERVFVSQHGQPFDRSGLSAILARYTQRAGLKKHITLHAFRHSFATHLLKRGASIRHVQEILGHEDLKTTQIYTRVQIKDLKEVYDRTHPRALEFALKHDKEKVKRSKNCQQI